MPVGDQLAYIGTLWDRVLEREAGVPVPQSHLEELSRRLAEHEAGPADVRPWAEVEAELRAESHIAAPLDERARPQARRGPRPPRRSPLVRGAAAKVWATVSRLSSRATFDGIAPFPLAFDASTERSVAPGSASFPIPLASSSSRHASSCSASSTSTGIHSVARAGPDDPG
ncbi:MAG: addiction module protein [Polyangiaceae bacterium]|nr:addiction module protein [Polyangiaceae bacterium]